MTEKLGVLLVDVPEPSVWEYSYIGLCAGWNNFWVDFSDSVSTVSQFGYKCTQEEAKKYPQFRWVALEELK